MRKSINFFMQSCFFIYIYIIAFVERDHTFNIYFNDTDENQKLT